MGTSFVDHLCYLSCVCHAFGSVHCCLVVTCREMAVMATWLLFVFSCDFVTFPFGILRQGWYLIVSIPDPCCLSYFECFEMVSKFSIFEK